MRPFIFKIKTTIQKAKPKGKKIALSLQARNKAMAIKQFITDIGPEDLSERFREKYK